MATALGKVAAAIYGEIAPTDTSFLWGKQLDAVGNPNLVSFFYHDGTDWLPLRGSDHFRDPVINQVATPPVSPTNGDRYLVSSSGTTGDFVGNENSIAVWNNGATSWEYTTASAGNFLYNSTDQVNVLFNGTEWLTQNKFTGDNIEITGGGGAILKVVGGEFQLRNAADTAFSSLTVENLTINGVSSFWNNNLTATDADTTQNSAISNIAAQTGVTTFDSLFQNIVTTGRTSTGEANHLRFQTNSVDVFKVDTSGFIKSGATFEHYVNGLKTFEIDEAQNVTIHNGGLSIENASPILKLKDIDTLGSDVLYQGGIEWLDSTNTLITKLAFTSQLTNSLVLDLKAANQSFVIGRNPGNAGGGANVILEVRQLSDGIEYSAIGRLKVLNEADGLGLRVGPNGFSGYYTLTGDNLATSAGNIRLYGRGYLANAGFAISGGLRGTAITSGDYNSYITGVNVGGSLTDKGGDIGITGGKNTFVSSNANGGDVILNGGLLNGTGLDGNVLLSNLNGYTTVGNGLIIPVGLDADRVVQEGSFRLNSTGNNTEIYKTVGGWVNLEGGGGAFVSDADTQITPSTAILLNHATNNEVAFALNYTINKAGGNDTGFLINKTDTLSSGTSYLFDAQVGGSSKFRISDNGDTTIVSGNLFINTSTVYLRQAAAAMYLGANGVDIGKVTSAGLESANANGASLINTASGLASPSIVPNKTDPNTGVGGNGSDILTLVAGGAEIVRAEFNAATKRLGFYGNVAVVQPSHILDADGTLADITTKFNQHLADMAALGLQAAS